MFIPRSIVAWFELGRELREELAALRAENRLLRDERQTQRVQNDWLRIRVNALEVERAQLLKKAYGIETPVPELVRTPQILPELGSALFEDVGDEAAKSMGLS